MMLMLLSLSLAKTEMKMNEEEMFGGDVIHNVAVNVVVVVDV